MLQFSLQNSLQNFVYFWYQVKGCQYMLISIIERHICLLTDLGYYKIYNQGTFK